MSFAKSGAKQARLRELSIAHFEIQGCARLPGEKAFKFWFEDLELGSSGLTLVREGLCSLSVQLHPDHGTRVRDSIRGNTRAPNADFRGSVTIDLFTH